MPKKYLKPQRVTISGGASIPVRKVDQGNNMYRLKQTPQP